MTEAKKPKLIWRPNSIARPDRATTTATLADLALYAGPGLAVVEDEDEGNQLARSNPGLDGDETAMQCLAEEMAGQVLARRIKSDAAALAILGTDVLSDADLRHAYCVYLRFRGPRPISATPPPERWFGYYRTPGSPDGAPPATEEDVEMLNHAINALRLGEPVAFALPDTVWIEGPFVAVSEADLAARALAEEHYIANESALSYVSFCAKLREMLAPSSTTPET